jgi:CTP:phosphocholine cytidylyltransferase-like protein
MKRGKNFYICESDQVVRDPEIFYRYVNQNQYMAKYIPGKTDEWTFELDENKRINRIKIGGEDAFNMVGITFWLSETGAYLAGVLDELYKNPVESGKLHWDNILDMNLYKLDMGIQEVYPEQIFEIDTFDELKRADPTYDTFHSV